MWILIKTKAEPAAFKLADFSIIIQQGKMIKVYQTNGQGCLEFDFEQDKYAAEAHNALMSYASVTPEPYQTYEIDLAQIKIKLLGDNTNAD